jgi:hypothetical protein
MPNKMQCSGSHKEYKEQGLWYSLWGEAMEAASMSNSFLRKVENID